MNEVNREYQDRLAKVRAKLDSLQRTFDLHDHVDLAKVDWALVGDLGHVDELLGEVIQFLNPAVGHYKEVT
jgi:hypothetical protein